jgi:CHAT domain-containing protein
MHGIWEPRSPATGEDLIELHGLILGGVVTLPSARQLAAETTWDSPGYLAVEIAKLAGANIVEGAGSANATTMATLGLAVAEAGGASDHDAPWRIAALAFVFAAGEAMTEIPDAARLAEMRAIGQRLIKGAATPSARGEATAAVAAACLAPFAATPAYATYAAQMAAWRERLELRDGLPARGVAIPDPAEGLRYSVSLLNDAAPLLDGPARARVLAGRACARFTESMLGEQVAAADIVSDCLDAWPLLDDSVYSQAQVMFTLDRLQQFDILNPYTLELPPVDAMVEMEGPRRAAMMVIMAIKIYSRRAPQVCRKLRSEMLAQLPADELEAERMWLTQIEAHILESDPLDCEAAASQWRSPMAATWSTSQSPDTVLHVLAHRPPGTDDAVEDEIENAAVAVQPADDAERERLAWVLLAARYLQRAYNQYRAGDYTAAAPLAAVSASILAGYTFRAHALAALGLLYNCLSDGPPEAAAAVIREIHDRADLIAAFLAGTGAGSRIRMLYGQVFTRLSEWTAPAKSEAPPDLVDLVLLAMQLAKGRALGSALARPGPTEDDEFVSRTLAWANRIEEGLGPSAGILRPQLYDDNELFDDEAFLGAIWHSREPSSGDSAVLAAANLRQRYQLLDQIRMTMSAARARAPYRSAEVSAALPADTVLAIFYYWGVGEPPHDGFHCLMITSDGAFYLAVSDPAQIASGTSMAWLGGDDGTSASVMYAQPGWQSAHVRRRIADDPLHGVASREALSALGDSAVHYGPVLQVLARLHDEGRNKLVIWPHGPQYVLPFHLLPTGDERLVADDWTVMVAPAVECVTGACQASGTRDFADTANAADAALVMASPLGGVPFGLAAEPSLSEQAAAVAREFGADPLATATRMDFARKAPGARYVHIAAHGGFYNPAPLFHQILLDDGPLYAHDVLKLDLRSVDLVTVSACESLLMRYDESDNILGMPAAFMRAGVSAVVGTLWPIEPETAMDFFVTLYGRLANGDDKLTAFRLAQADTRRRHAEYRDWGAFCMLGGR